MLCFWLKLVRVRLGCALRLYGWPRSPGAQLALSLVSPSPLLLIGTRVNFSHFCLQQQVFKIIYKPLPFFLPIPSSIFWHPRHDTYIALLASDLDCQLWEAAVSCSHPPSPLAFAAVCTYLFLRLSFLGAAGRVTHILERLSGGRYSLLFLLLLLKGPFRHLPLNLRLHIHSLFVSFVSYILHVCVLWWYTEYAFSICWSTGHRRACLLWTPGRTQELAASSEWRSRRHQLDDA